MSDNNNDITALTQVLRYYAEPYNSKYEDKPKDEGGEKNKELSGAEIQAAMQNAELEAVKNAVGPAWGAWGGPTLVFDTETQTSFGHTMRFGSYTLRGHDYQTLMKLAVEYKGAVPRDVLDQETSRGFFINRDVVTDDEDMIIQQYARKGGYQYMTKEFFLKRLFYALYVSSGPRLVRSPIHGGLEPGKTLPCMIVGHNLPFDLGRLTYSYGYARDRMFGGLTYKLLKHRPDIAVKKLGFAKAMYKAHTDKNDRSNHIFVDTQQLGRALCGASVNSSLQGLAKALKLSSPNKLEMDFDGPITIEALDYNANDVDLTWRVYQGLRDIYEKDGYTCTDDKGMLLKPITQLLSEASRGKGLLQELGIKQPRTKFDKDEWHNIFAVAMASTYGGRAEVRHRLDIVEGIHVDFKSQYTSAYLWLGLEKLLKAERISVVTDENGTGSAANWLRSVTLDTLSDPSQGPNLAGYALIETDGAILPIRSEYQYFDHFLGQVEYNHQIGVNRVVSGPRCWYSFPDIVASIIKTKNCPRILKTMTFKAEGKQTGMMVKDLFGDKNYHIDPNGDEPVFKRLIDLRTVAKAEDNEGKEQGIKILASATSYGITIEFILEDRITDDLYESGTTHSRVITPVQTPIDQQLYPFRKTSKTMLGEDNVEEVKVEKPGSYAAPWGPLIPAAGRLMLAIAEQFAADRGIPYGLCDTDSMDFIRPRGMERDTFRQGVKEITGWFQALMPYEDKSESLFNIEKHNYRLKRDEQGNVVRKNGKPEIVKGEFEPLYLLAVSAKRYGQANFHECADGVSVFKGNRGHWVLRKVSAHGLGHITAPKYNYKAVVRHNKTGLPEHDAAPQLYDDGKPVFNKKGEIIWQHGSICKGQNPRLFLDLWRAAFEEVCSYDGKLNPDDSVDVQRHGLFASADDRFEDWFNHRMNRFIETMPGLEQPQMVQRSLSTANDMRTYNNLPNKAPGSFFNTFPQPMMSPMFDQIAVADLIKLKEFKMSSLYAHGGKDIDVSTIESAKRYGLTRRDNGQFPVEVFDEDWGIKLKTVAESLNKYFVHPEFKSQGKVGQLAIRNVIIVNHTYSGKKANRTIEIPEDLTPDDEDSLNKLSIAGWLNISLMKSLGAKPIAELLGITEDRVKRTLFRGQILNQDKMTVLIKSIRFNSDGRPHLLIERKKPFMQLDLPKTEKVKECRRLIGVIYKKLAKTKETDATMTLDYIMQSYVGAEKDREIVSTYVEDFIRYWLGEKWLSAPNKHMDAAIELVHIVSGVKQRREEMQVVRDKYDAGKVVRLKERRQQAVLDRKAAIAALTPPVYFIYDVRGEPVPINHNSKEHLKAWEFTCRHATAANYEEIYTAKLDRIYKRKRRSSN